MRFGQMDSVTEILWMPVLAGHVSDPRVVEHTWTIPMLLDLWELKLRKEAIQISHQLLTQEQMALSGGGNG